MIPITSLLTFAINIAIPSAAGVGAVVGTTLIPLLLRAGFKPAAAAAAVLMGTTGSLLSPACLTTPMFPTWLICPSWT